MAVPTIEKLYEFSLIQLAAESYLENESIYGEKDPLSDALTLGTNRVGYNNSDNSDLGDADLNQGWPGFTRMTDSQFEEFYEKFKVIHQWTDNPSTGGIPGYRPEIDTTHTAGLLLNSQDMLANTGFSATLIQHGDTSEYTLAIRSTESRAWEGGGDSERDMEATDKDAIVITGFAPAQLDALEKYYEWLQVNGLLPKGSTLNVTGYSLGGHLATVFTEIHQDDPWLGEFGDTVTFNGAGRGNWNAAAGSEADFLAYYRQVLKDPASAGISLLDFSLGDLSRAAAWLVAADFTVLDGPLYLELGEALTLMGQQQSRAMDCIGQPFDATSIYQDPRYAWAMVATILKFDLTPQSPLGAGSTLADSEITQVYGRESIHNINMTANSQNNGPELPIAIESQPVLHQDGGFVWGGGDYGYGHSITLIIDSLALQRAIGMLDPGFDSSVLLAIMPKMSAMDTRNVLFTAYEADPLENILDSLRYAVLGPGIAETTFRPGAGGFGDWDKRNAYHANIQALTDSEAFKAIAGKVQFCMADGAQLYNARQDFASFLGLYTLSPVYLRALPGEEAFVAEQLAAAWPELYAEWQADATSSPAEFYSAQWLQDRYGLLAGTLAVNAANADDRTTRDPAGIEGLHYQDYAWDGEVTVLPAHGDEVRRQVLFDTNTPFAPLVGSDFADRLYAGTAGSGLEGGGGDDQLEGRSGNDTLLGGTGRDQLRGMAGNDVLIGGKDADRLEGGLGEDEYRIAIGDGVDTLRDSDGKGYIVLNGQRLEGGLQESANAWRSPDGKFRYVLELTPAGGSRLMIYPAEGNRGSDVTVLLVEDFHPGDLGLVLPGAPAPGPVLPQPIPGDVDPARLTQFNADGSTSEYLQWDAFGNIIGTPGALPRPDMLFGSSAGEEIFGGVGNDTLYGLAGEDKIYGESDHDFIAAGLGRDRLFGGDGNDILYGDSEPWQPGTLAGMDPVPATATPPVAGASFVDSGIGWVRFEADAGTLPPVSNANPDAITPVLRQLAPERFGRVALITADRSDYGPGVGDDDVIEAGSGDDLLYGEGGHDRLFGEGGADHLFGGRGVDMLYGGTEDDLLFGDSMVYAGFRWSQLDLMGPYRTTSLVETYEAEYGSDLLFGGDGADYLFGMAGADLLHGEGGNDYLVGDFFEVESIPVLRLSDDGSQFITDTSTHFAEAVAHHGNDFLDGGEGDDYLIGLAGDDTLYGGAGADVLIADGNPDEVQGRYGDDALLGEGGADFLLGSGGDDRMFGGDDDDILWGDEYAGTDGEVLASWGDVAISGGSRLSFLAQEAHGGDEMYGGGGNDSLIGGGRADYLYGDEGDDHLFGDGVGVLLEGDDHLFGGDGNDELQGGGGKDILMGQAGQDRLFGQAGLDTLDGGDGDDYLDGGADVDTLEGGEGADTLYGGTADDTLQGGGGNDFLLGDAGDDTLSGGAGQDFLAGGEGDDTYVLRIGDGIIVDNVYEVIDDSEGANRLQLTGTASSAVILGVVADSNDLTLKYGADDAVYIRNGLRGAMTSFQFDDITLAWDELVARQLTDPVVSRTGVNNGYLVGGRGDDHLELGSDSSVRASAGADTIFLRGLRNTVLFNEGDGQDRVESSPVAAAADTGRVRFGAGITPDQLFLELYRDPTQAWAFRLEIRVGADGQDRLSLPIDIDTPLAAPALGYFEFADGSVLDFATLLATRGISVPGTAASDLLFGTALGDYLSGGANHDDLQGRGGDDILDGGAGNDVLRGGEGSDHYLFRLEEGDDLILEGGSDAGAVDVLVFGEGITPDHLLFGRDAHDLTIRASEGMGSLVIRGQIDEAVRPLESFRFADGTELDADAVLARAIEGPLPLFLRGGEGSDTLSGGAADDRLFGLGETDFLYGLGGDDALQGGDAPDRLEGGDGDDVLSGDAGDDFLYGDAGQDTLQGGAGADELQGQAGDDQLAGDGGDDRLYGGDGDDRLEGGEGQDWLDGATGHDSLQGGAGDDVLEGGEGDDVLGGEAGVDWLAGNAGNDVLDGGADHDTLWGGDGHDILQGGDDADSLEGEAGDDVLYGDAGVDTLLGGDGSDELWGGDGDDALLRGGAGHDILHGGAGDDFLDGEVSADILYGDDGNDHLLLDPYYFVGADADAAGGASDGIAHGGAGDDTLNGGFGSDRLYGDEGNDLLYLTSYSANVGVDTLAGGAGDDTYFLEIAVAGGAAVLIVENSGEGTDTVVAYTHYTLADHLENLTLEGFNDVLDLNGTGNALDNTLRGNIGINILTGGAGNDRYFVGAGDRVVEMAGAGTDTVYADTNWVLGSYLENLVLTGPALDGTGNTQANVLEGNAGANRLDGAGGADRLIGGAGDDVYIIDNAGDILVEADGEGLDTARSSVTVALLAANVENLVLTGSKAINGTGNALGNRLSGNGAANIFKGGLGDDVYVVGKRDTAVEAAGEGNDTVESAISWTLGAHLENLVLTGSSAINGSGNALANRLRGNAASNTLTGMAGDDTYLFGRGGGADTIVDSDSTAGNQDVLLLEAGIDHDQLWFRHVSNHLEVSVIGSSDKVTISNWYSGGSNHVETIRLADGHYLVDAQVEQLVQAMATMTPPPPGQAFLSDLQRQQMDPVLAASWQVA